MYHKEIRLRKIIYKTYHTLTYFQGDIKNRSYEMQIITEFMVTQTQICTAISKLDDHSVASLPQG